MIQIRLKNKIIITEHFEGVRHWILQAIEYYKSVFEIINGKSINLYSNRSWFVLSKIILKNEIKLYKKDKEKITKNDFKRILTSKKSEICNFYVINGIKIIKLLEKLKEKHQDIIVSEPIHLIKIYDEIELNFSFIPKRSSSNFELNKNVEKLLYNIFNYDRFSRKSGMSITKWNAYDLAYRLNINVCPYCNRLYTFTVINKKEQIIRPVFDHFFPKSDYPIFALSLYNLIPSCTICNSTLKGKKEMNIDNFLHPYIEGADYAIFSFIYNSFYDGNSLNTISETIKLTIKTDLLTNEKKKKIENNFNLFKIKEIYSQHKDIVSEIILKNKLYTKEYFEILEKQYPDISQDDLYRIAYGNYNNIDDFNLRPLAKLTKDIVSEINKI